MAIAAAVLLWVYLAGSWGAVSAVDAAKVRRSTLEITLPVTGIFETLNTNLAFETPGRLARVLVREGQAVRKGDVVALLEDADLQALVAQAEAGAQAAINEATRAAAGVDAARQQAAQAEAAYRAAQAQLAQLRAGVRTSELQQAEAAVEAARSARDQAQRNLAIQEQLYRDGAIAKAQLDAARAQYENANATYRQVVAQRDALRAGPRPESVEIATEQVRQAQAAWGAAQANVRQAQAIVAAARANAEQALAAARAARIRADRAQLRAPFDGFIGRVYLNPGSPVGPGVPVISVVGGSGWVTADVDEADIGKVHVGQPARITADAYPGRLFTGRVSDISRQVDVKLGTRTVRVRVELDTVVEIRAGTSVDVDIVLQTLPDVLLAPLEAVITGEDGGPHVYVISRGVLQRRAVSVGPSNEVQVVISSGVSEGEVLAIADPGALREGARVRVRSMR